MGQTVASASLLYPMILHTDPIATHRGLLRHSKAWDKIPVIKIYSFSLSLLRQIFILSIIKPIFQDGELKAWRG
jgi:hypothetical protein